MTQKKVIKRKKKKREEKDVMGRIAGPEGESHGTEGSHKETAAGGATVAVDLSPCWFQK